MVGLPSRPTSSAASGNSDSSLIRIGNQIDDDLHVLPHRLDVIFAGGKQSQRVGVVGGILEEIFGRRVAGKRGIQRQNTKIRGRFCRRPPDQRLDSCRFCICGLGSFAVTLPLLDAADPVHAVGIARIERDRLPKTLDRRLDFIELEVGLAQLMAQLAILRPLADHFEQQRPRHNVLLS